MNKLIFLLIILIIIPISLAETQDAEIIFGDSGVAANGDMVGNLGNVTITSVYFLKGRTVSGVIGEALDAIRGWIEEILIANTQDFIA